MRNVTEARQEILEEGTGTFEEREILQQLLIQSERI